MPEIPDSSRINDLRRLVAASFATEDFEERAERLGIAQETIVRFLSESGLDEIWRAAAAQQIELEKLETEYARKLDEAIKLTLVRQSRSVRALRNSLLVILPISLLAYFAVWYISAPTSPVDKLLLPPSWFSVAFFVVGFASPVAYYFFKRSRRQSEVMVRYTVEHQADFRTLQGKIEEAKKKVEEALIAQGVKPKIRELLDAQLRLGFTRHLPKLNFSGLSEVFNSANEVATDAKRQLEFMLTTMPGGSIGIAGPRGSGKSTLLRSACKDMPDNLTKRKVMPLLTTSPVEYSGRDFILHLFSSMCVKILETTGKDPRATLEEITEPERPRSNRVFANISRLARLAAMLGLSLIIFSVVLVLLTLNAPQPAPAAVQQPAPAQNGTAPSSTASPTPTPAPTPRFVVRFLQGLDLKPGTLFIWGVLMIGFDFITSLLYRSYLRRPYNEGRIYTDRSDPLYDMNISDEFRTRLSQRSEDARQWLKDIKFQQSYTSGWSGALKLPIGLEGGVNAAVSLAQQQLSLPDITKGFCNFLSAIGTDLKVIIGIDELDKLESDVSAQRFLNEIKAVFGLPNVFYLISVSENAMSNFERRGVPFRDVFDSSFDNIVYVDYLSLEYARRLVARRIIGMPPPFVHLCYCISGGLARDLVRICRNLMQYSHKAYETSPQGRDSNLKKLSRALIKADLQLKLHALTVATKDVNAGARLNSFLTQIHKLESELDSPAALMRAYQDLLKASRPGPADKATTDRTDTSLEETPDKSKQPPAAEATTVSEPKTLYALNEELASYIYYCVTILQFFNDVLDETTMVEAERRKAFDELARARQYLAINAKVCRGMLDKFRKSFKMEVPSAADRRMQGYVQKRKAAEKGTPRPLDAKI